MRVREFVPNDLRRVHFIHETSFDQSYGLAIFRKLYDIGAGFLVAEDNGLVVGYILFWIKEENVGHIISIAVDKKYRCLKAGTMLLSRAISTLKICKLNKITLEVNENNKIAINFYKKFNFQVDRLVPKYYDNGDGALVLYLDI